MKVSVPPKIEVLTRKKAIFNIVAEISQLILGNSSIEKALYDGILERDILVKISFQIRHTKSREIVAEVSVEIDWKQHKIAVEASGATVVVEAGKSVSEQIIESANHIASLIVGYKKEYPSTFVTTSYKYRPEIESDANLNKESMDFLGHVNSKPDDRVWHQPEGNYRVTELSVRPKNLEEIAVSVKGVSKLSDG